MRKEIQEAIVQCKDVFDKIDNVALCNQQRVLDAFNNNKVALMHFNQTTGYGYDDVGRDTLGKVVASLFGTESAIVSPLITSGTHALTLALFGVLRPDDVALAVSGQPYDTLHDTIFGENIGSLKDFGIHFECIDLKDGTFDYDAIACRLKKSPVKMVYVQRSRGYSWRKAFTTADIAKLCAFVRSIQPETCIMCDNCYGEFVETCEPTAVGVDLVAGSFIKNIGGSLAPTGGYIAGLNKYVGLVAGRLTSPSVGCEIGSYVGGYRQFYQGLFLAPHVVSQAVKTAVLFSYVLNKRGYDVLPKYDDTFGDIVCSVKLNDAEKLIKFCQSIQSASPVDGFVTPQPWDMPGYDDQVIMAAGCFVQGSSIELSCDGPIRPPYIAYLQGGITFEHGIIALEKVLDSLDN